MGNILRAEDFVGAGFERLDEHLIEQHPPKIKWGQLYRDMDHAEQVRYLERVAAAMNHAAALIQGERDQLIALCHQKEEQLKAMNRAMGSNNAMLQQEITRLNEDRQQMISEMTKLRTELRDLKSGG